MFDELDIQSFLSKCRKRKTLLALSVLSPSWDVSSFTSTAHRGSAKNFSCFPQVKKVPISLSVQRNGGLRLRLKVRVVFRFQFFWEDTKHLIKLLISLLPVCSCAQLTPEQPQGELCAESLEQFGDWLPASCWNSASDTWSDQIPPRYKFHNAHSFWA